MKIWAEIKKAINSDLSKPLDTLIKEYLGNSTYGLSALKTLMTGGKIPIVKSVQRGTVYYSGSNNSISINTVKPDKCIVIINSYSSHTRVTNYGVHEGAYLSSLSATSLTIEVNTGNYSSVSASWQVIEFY